MTTTLIRKNSEQPRQDLPECHDGQGVLDWKRVLDNEYCEQTHLNFLHDDVLKPGVSIGIHSHEYDEEYYYILSGTGVMTLDHVEFAVSAGDVAAVYPGGSHGLVNNGMIDMRIIVFSCS